MKVSEIIYYALARNWRQSKAMLLFLTLTL